LQTLLTEQRALISQAASLLDRRLRVARADVMLGRV